MLDVLKTYDYRSRGADLASPRNQHLQDHGLICLPEMARLAGMVTERYYNSRGFGLKGAMLPISHARSAGLVLYACQAGLDLGE